MRRVPGMSRGARRTTPGPGTPERLSPGALRPAALDPGALDPAALRLLADTCDAIARGDLEQRVPPLGDHPELARARGSINHLVDMTDAFVREAGASLGAASEGRFERAFLRQGMPGSFGRGADEINAARRSMRASAERDAERQRMQAEVAETVFGASQMVASAAVELNASAESLGHSTETAVERTDEAMDTVNELERASAEIQQAATVISGVAAQTRLLALNATIEAARAGTAGRGFAVVAQEVKSLADEAAAATETIRKQIANAQAGAAATIQAIQEIVATVREVDTQVEEILRAAGGREDGAGGLSQMAERLHAETGRLLSEHTGS